MVAQNLKVVLATTFTFYLKAHKFHWNVMGSDFAQQHEFLGDLWEETFAAIDPIAEAIRTLGEFAPGSLSEFMELSYVEDSVEDVSNGQVMFSTLITDNELVIQSLNEAYEVSELDKTFDVSDLLAQRISAHKKHGWMLNSFLSKQQG